MVGLRDGRAIVRPLESLSEHDLFVIWLNVVNTCENFVDFACSRGIEDATQLLTAWLHCRNPLTREWRRLVHSYMRTLYNETGNRYPAFPWEAQVETVTTGFGGLGCLLRMADSARAFTANH